MSAKLTLLPNIRKIAVLGANSLSDFIFVLPALDALRDTYPQAEIVYLGKEWHASFVPQRVPSIDRVVPTPPYAGVGEAINYPDNQHLLNNFFTRMQTEQFDLALQMHGDGQYSNSFTKQLGAKLSVGSHTAGAEALDVQVPFSLYQHGVLRYLEIVRLVGATSSAIMPRLFVTEADIAIARALTGKSRYIVVHPGASDPRRRWPAALFAQVAKHFLQQDVRVFVTGTSEEQSIAEIVTKRTDGKTHNVSGALDLGGMAGLLARAEVSISNDTGPLHLARAVDCPTVGLYWCGDYITAAPMELQKHQSLLSWITTCPVCHAPSVGPTATCAHEASLVQNIPVSEVIQAAEIIRRRL